MSSTDNEMKMLWNAAEITMKPVLACHVKTPDILLLYNGMVPVSLQVAFQKTFLHIPTSYAPRKTQKALDLYVTHVCNPRAQEKSGTSC